MGILSEVTEQFCGFENNRISWGVGIVLNDQQYNSCFSAPSMSLVGSGSPVRSIGDLSW